MRLQKILPLSLPNGMVSRPSFQRRTLGYLWSVQQADQIEVYFINKVPPCISMETLLTTPHSNRFHGICYLCVLLDYRFTQKQFELQYRRHHDTIIISVGDDFIFDCRNKRNLWNPMAKLVSSPKDSFFWSSLSPRRIRQPTLIIDQSANERRPARSAKQREEPFREALCLICIVYCFIIYDAATAVE